MMRVVCKFSALALVIGPLAVRASRSGALSVHSAVATVGSESPFEGEAATALSAALEVVGKSDSEELRKLVASFEPQYMLAGGTSQAKDSLMMMLMGLPFAFQAGGIGTRIPCLYRLFKGEPGTELTTVMRYIDGLSPNGPVKPEEVVSKIEQHMGKYADPSRFGEKPIEILVTGPDLSGAVYKNMMGRVVGRAADPESMKNSKDIDDIYDYHVADDNVILMAVEKAQTMPENSMIAGFASKVDPTGKRTLWVKTWADFGITEQMADSGRTCASVQEYFRQMDFKKPAGSPATFWIATIEAEAYLQDRSLSLQQRMEKLEEAIAKKEAKMQKFIDGWNAKGCHFDFEDNIKVTKLRTYLSELHSRQVTERLPALVAALERTKGGMALDVKGLGEKLEMLPKGDSPSAELREFTGMYKVIFDEQFIGERIPPALGVSTVEIREIQDKEFKMTAKDMATALLEDWKKLKHESYDVAFDRKMEESANMLLYPSALEQLSTTGHHWSHLTNIYMLVVRSLKELIDKTTLSWNLAATGITGGNLCNAAAREARETFLSGASKKGAALLEYGIKWLLTKHVKVTRELVMAMPRHEAYAKDVSMMAELDVVEQSFIDDWTAGFKEDYLEQLRKATLNIQQAKILKTLHGMENLTTKSSLAYDLTKCEEIPGAEKRDKEEFPACKCKSTKETLFCGVERVADRKFDAMEIKELIQCKYSEPYCAQNPSKHDLRDLAVVLNPQPTIECEKLYEELVDSAVDLLVMHVGSQLYFMAYDTVPTATHPIRKNPEFAGAMYSRLKGEKSDDYLAKAFTGMGQRQHILANMEAVNLDITEIEKAIEFFKKAMVKGQQMN